MFAARNVLFSANSLDPAITAFAAASGATDLVKLNDLVKYLKAQTLWANCQIYPFKSAQNAGSGASVFTLGGLGGGTATLVNSPTWGAGGVSFVLASSQYAWAADFIDAGDMVAFHRMNYTNGSAVQFLGQYNTSSTDRSWVIGTFQSRFDVARTQTGAITTSGADFTTTGGATGAGADNTFVALFDEGVNFPAGGIKLWLNKTPVSLSQRLGNGTNTGRLNTAVRISWSCINADSTPSNFATQTAIATLILVGVIPSDAQREAITDLINAL